MHYSPFITQNFPLLVIISQSCTKCNAIKQILHKSKKGCCVKVMLHKAEMAVCLNSIVGIINPMDLKLAITNLYRLPSLLLVSLLYQLFNCKYNLTYIFTSLQDCMSFFCLSYRQCFVNSRFNLARFNLREHIFNKLCQNLCLLLWCS